jgi:uncharacterized RDD family membrane protein YckC
VRASAAQNAPVNTICSQCGSVLAPGEHLCKFCDSNEVLLIPEESVSTERLSERERSHQEWRGELNQRLEDYRSRRRRTVANEAQAALPFDDRPAAPGNKVAVDVEEAIPNEPAPVTDDFAFTIAIGRVSNPAEADPRLLIDVSVPAQAETEATAPEKLPELQPIQNGLFPTASIDERRRALLIDAACLAFAYGGFLALFSSLGGHFTLSKLSATVCCLTFAFVYVQYFGLFTIFGGSTPGMMFSGIQVASFTGDAPTGRQYLLRAAGYLLSAGTCFLGFFWVLWDEDGLTWHDRLSKTYLARIESLGEESISQPANAR